MSNSGDFSVTLVEGSSGGQQSERERREQEQKRDREAQRLREEIEEARKGHPRLGRESGHVKGRSRRKPKG